MNAMFSIGIEGVRTTRTFAEFAIVLLWSSFGLVLTALNSALGLGVEFGLSQASGG